ncbi:hypothetical protein PR048_007627 [Dryococelus australis]|uniref:Uncharacterized protein n=1 Tax=Dryococelus australis TaxID=614101 RepID=A0ABQ9HV06_9NEOP|nr:hypothetical protein PR048_007627 [Dryococelus australis]
MYHDINLYKMNPLDLNLLTDLSSQDWNLLDSLKIFHAATVNISSEETTIAEVIPVVNGLKAALKSRHKPTNEGYEDRDDAFVVAVVRKYGAK